MFRGRATVSWWHVLTPFCFVLFAGNFATSDVLQCSEQKRCRSRSQNFAEKPVGLIIRFHGIFEPTNEFEDAQDLFAQLRTNLVLLFKRSLQ
jgi:hypothetical protein